jgi:hypothetical protein
VLDSFVNIDTLTFHNEVNVTLDLAEYYQKEFEMECWYINHDKDYEPEILTVQEAAEINPDSAGSKILAAAKKVWDWIKKAIHRIVDWFKKIGAKIFGSVKLKETNDAVDNVSKTINENPDILNVLSNVGEALKETGGGEVKYKSEYFTYKTTGEPVQEAATTAIAVGALKAIVKFSIDINTGGVGNYIEAGSIATDSKNFRNLKPIKGFRMARAEVTNLEKIGSLGALLLGANKDKLKEMLSVIYDPISQTIFGCKIPPFLSKVIQIGNVTNMLSFAILIDWIIKTIKDMRNPETHNRNVVDAAFEVAVDTARKIADIAATNMERIEMIHSKALMATLNDDIKKQEDALEYLDKMFRSKNGITKLINDTEWTSHVQARHLNMLNDAINKIDANLNDRDSYLGKLAMGIMDKAGMNNLPNNNQSQLWNDQIGSDKSHLISEHSVMTKLIVKFTRSCSDLVIIGQAFAGMRHDFYGFISNVFKNILMWHHGVVKDANENNEHATRLRDHHKVNEKFKADMKGDVSVFKRDTKKHLGRVGDSLQNIGNNVKDNANELIDKIPINKSGVSSEAPAMA